MAEDNNEDFEFNKDGIPQEFLQMWGSMQRNALPPHLFVQTFDDYDEFVDYLEEYELDELIALYEIFSKDLNLPEDFLTIISIQIKRQSLGEIRSDLVQILGEVKEVDIILDYIDNGFLGFRQLITKK